MNDSDLNAYVGYFAGQLEAVAQLEDRLFRKILTVAMVDTWSRAVYPAADGHRNRFTDFVGNYSGWEDADRVNPWHLQSLLHQLDDDADSPLRVATKEILAGRSEGEMVRLRRDPIYSDLVPLSIADEVSLLKQSTHLSLFYLYRCDLVHEFREPGHGMEFDSEACEPFYHSMMGDDGDTWELVYPLGFFAELAVNCLTNLRESFLSSGGSPHESYFFGSPWRK